MKLKLSKNGICMFLNNKEIEEQALNDLVNYNRIYSSKYKILPSFPLDIESFVKELWGVDVSYSELKQTEEEECLGQFDPISNAIIVDAKACNNQGRISFTIAHEAGHLSLHKFLYKKENEKITTYNKNGLNKDLERQADLYASLILAPQNEVISFFESKGLSFNDVIDLDIHAVSLQDHFGLSRYALEIRLQRLGIGFTGGRYINLA